MAVKKEKYSVKTKYGKFTATIWYEAGEKLYLVEILSFDKTMTQGSSLREAKRMARELIELLCEVAFNEGKAVVDDEKRIVGRGKLGNISGPTTIITT